MTSTEPSPESSPEPGPEPGPESSPESSGGPSPESSAAPAADGSALAGVPTARALVRELRKVRRGHSDRSVWQAFELLYLWLFAIAMIGSMAGATVARSLDELSRCAGSACTPQRNELLVVAGFVVLVVALRAMLAFGPVVASRATSSWLLSTPVDRRALLTGRAATLVGTALVVAAGIFALVIGTGRTSGSTGSAVLLGAAVGGALGLLVAALALVAQQRGRARRVVGVICDVVLIVKLIAAPILVISGTPLPSGLLGSGTLTVLAVVALVLAIPLAVLGFRGLGGVPGRELVSGGDLLAGLSGAAASMDTSMVADVVTGRRFQRIGARRSRRGRGIGPSAVAYREAIRMLRSPGRLVLAVGLLAVPYALSRVGVPSLGPVAAALAGYIAIRPFGGGLHVVIRSRGARRWFPMPDLHLVLAFAAPALAAALIWALAALPALLWSLGSGAGAYASSDAFPVWICVAASIAGGVVRSVTRKPVSFEGPLISSPAGALPAGFVAQLLRGPDFLLVGILPLALGLSAPVAAVVPLILVAWALARPERRTDQGMSSNPWPGTTGT